MQAWPAFPLVKVVMNKNRAFNAMLVIGLAAFLSWIWLGGGLSRIVTVEKSLQGTMGSTQSASPQSVGARSPTASPRAVPGQVPSNYASDSEGRPLTSSPSPDDLRSVSQGGGYGPKGSHDYEAIAPFEISSPEMNLVIRWVPKGILMANGVQTVDVPVSFQAGWVNSTSPIGSSSGSSVFVGHVNYVDGSWAPMSNIHYAEPGMIVHVSNGQGDVESFTVTSREVVPQTRISDIVDFTATGARQLILITCGGPVENGAYTHNEVVFARPTVSSR
jgi:hypothetical protein